MHPGERLARARPGGLGDAGRVDAGLDQPLAQLALARLAEEEVGDRAERQQAVQHHHHGARVGLVLQRLDAPRPRRGRVRAVEGRPREPVDVGDRQPHDPDAEHVDALHARAEPVRRGERLDDRRPQQQAEEQERRLLEDPEGPVLEHRAGGRPAAARRSS